MAWNDLSDLSYLWNPPPPPEGSPLTSFMKGYMGASMAKKERIASEEEAYKKGIEATGTGEGVPEVKRGFAFQDFAKGVLGYGTGGAFDQAQLYRKANELREQQIKNQAANQIVVAQKQRLDEQIQNQRMAGENEIGNLWSSVGQYEGGWTNPEFQSKIFGAMSKIPSTAQGKGIAAAAISEIRNAETFKALQEKAKSRAEFESQKESAAIQKQKELYSEKTKLEQEKAKLKTEKKTSAEIKQDPDWALYQTTLQDISKMTTSPDDPKKPITAQEKQLLRLRAKKVYETSKSAATPAAAPSAPSASVEKVRMKNPDGVVGLVPKDQVDAAKKLGYQEIQ